MSSVVYLPLHSNRFISIVCLHNFHVLKTFIKIAYSPPSSRYNALSNEGISTQRDQRISVLRKLVNRFKRNDNENVQITFDQLTDISNELQALGAADITEHEMVKKLLRSLDSSFDTVPH